MKETRNPTPSLLLRLFDRFGAALVVIAVATFIIVSSWHKGSPQQAERFFDEVQQVTNEVVEHVGNSL